VEGTEPAPTAEDSGDHTAEVTGEHTDERPAPSRRTLTLIVSGIVVLFAMGAIGVAFHPVLINDHPLLLVALDPRDRWIVAAVAEGVGFWPIIVWSTFRKLIGDPLFYLLGYLYGDGAVKWAEKRLGPAGELAKGAEKWFKKAPWFWVALTPGIPACTLAGAVRMHFAWFMTCNFVGTIIRIVLIYHFAGLPFVEGPVDAITGFYGDNARWLLPLSIGLTALWVFWESRRGGIESVDRLESELTESDETAS
jgi:membrane protein DedA with SNARE-associated domain